MLIAERGSFGLLLMTGYRECALEICHLPSLHLAQVT
jgi:hypothetical protein